MTDYQNLEAAHLGDPLSAPAHDDEDNTVTIQCHRCQRLITRPAREPHWDGICPGCNRSVFEPLQDDEQHLAVQYQGDNTEDQDDEDKNVRVQDALGRERDAADRDHPQHEGELIMSEPTIFTTPVDFIRTIVHPALGEHADDYDVDAIADQVLEYYSPPRGVDPAWRDDNRTGFIQRQDVDFWEVVRRNENTPAPAATGDEGNELAKRSIATAYLFHRPSSTGVTFGTWSGTNLNMKTHMVLVVPVEAVQRIYADGQGLIRINPECVAEQSASVRELRDEQRKKELKAARNRLQSEISEEFDAEIDALEGKLTALYDEIDRRVELLLKDQEGDQ